MNNTRGGEGHGQLSISFVPEGLGWLFSCTSFARDPNRRAGFPHIEIGNRIIRHIGFFSHICIYQCNSFLVHLSKHLVQTLSTLQLSYKDSVLSHPRILIISHVSLSSYMLCVWKGTLGGGVWSRTWRRLRASPAGTPFCILHQQVTHYQLAKSHLSQGNPLLEGITGYSVIIVIIYSCPGVSVRQGGESETAGAEGWDSRRRWRRKRKRLWLPHPWVVRLGISLVVQWWRICLSATEPKRSGACSRLLEMTFCCDEG